jgi:hypothetical protein
MKRDSKVENDDKCKIKTRLKKYHDALRRGRHPKSFPMKSSLFWSTIRDTDSRRKKMQTGQRFEKVVGIYDKEKRQPERRTAIAWMLAKSRDESGGHEQQDSSVISDERSVGSQLSRKTSTKGKRKVNISDQFRKSLKAARNARNRKNEAVLAGGNTKVKVFFGSKIALEQKTPNGNSLWLTVKPNGEFVVAPRDSGVGQYVFRIMHLGRQSESQALRFGESCWLSISNGLGENWKAGGCVGTKIRNAVNLIQDNHREDEALGKLVPISAYMPSDFEHRMTRPDHKDRLARNDLALAVGKWKIQPAVRYFCFLNVRSLFHTHTRIPTIKTDTKRARYKEKTTL